MTSSATSPVRQGAEAADDGAVVFVHGWGCGAEDWDGVRALLSSNRPTLAVRLPGSPGAASAPPNVSVQGAADFVAEAARRAGFQRFALVGHSMGARIALALAARSPQTVSRFLLVDGSCVPQNPHAACEQLRGAHERLGRRAWADTAIASMLVDRLAPAKVRALVRRLEQTPQSILLADYAAMAAWDRDSFGAALDCITCPTTVFQATALDDYEVRARIDDACGSLWLDTFNTRSSSAQIVKIPDTGHFVMLEKPALIARWIDAGAITVPDVQSAFPSNVDPIDIRRPDP